MDGSESLAQHWDHLHTLLSFIALLFAYLALRASKKIKLQRLAGQANLTQAVDANSHADSVVAAHSNLNQATADQSGNKQFRENQSKISPSSSAPDQHADVAQLLTLLQQQARLLDFAAEDISHITDQQVGAVARSVHAGLQKTLREYINWSPILPNTDSVTIAANFDPQQIRLTGQLRGNGPYQGQLVHAGWRLTAVTLPQRGSQYRADILQAAEVEV